jgi:hypothetical protein
MTLRMLLDGCQAVAEGAQDEVSVRDFLKEARCLAAERKYLEEEIDVSDFRSMQLAPTDDDLVGRNRTKACRISARFVPHCAPALSTKHSYLRDEVDPTRFRSAHFTSRRGAEYGWELQRRRYSRPQGFGDRPSSAVAARGLTCDDPLRPAKANLVKVEIRVMWADVVEHTGDGATHPIIEAFS